MTASKKFIADYLPKSPSNGKGHHLACLSLEVVIDKFGTLASPNYRNFVSGSKRFVCSGMDTMDSIMALKDHSSFKYVHSSRFSKQSKNKIFIFKMSVDLLGSGVDLVKRMHVEEIWRIYG